MHTDERVTDVPRSSSTITRRTVAPNDEMSLFGVTVVRQGSVGVHGHWEW